MSTENDKNETSRFLGEGVSFKAKLIGILEVSEARGDRMCQEALSDLKMAIRAAGEHKQRITINIAIDGLRLRDEKTGDSLYHHPVHKISFIAQDMSDSRAFGYIFGSPDTGHRFFGIKTDKAASQVVIAMRDLFQVVFALKKKEIELAKQHLDKGRYGTSPLFSERSLLSLKNNSQETSKSSASDTKGASSTENRSAPAVADLVDLELELNSLQQGLTQMERITPSDPFGSKDDPFGDSFTSFPVGNKSSILPPPPSSGRERSNRTSESSSIFSPKTPHTAASVDSGSAADIFTTHELNTPKEFSFNEFNSSHDEPSSGDWFTPPAGNSLFEEPPLLEPTKDQQHEAAKQEIMSQFDVFTELDPLGTKTLNTSIGTGKIKPYVDKKHFFQELKNPPKKVLNDLVSESQPQESPLFTPAGFEQKNNGVNKSSNSIYNNDPFGEDPFDNTDPFADSDFSKTDVFEVEFNDFKGFNTQTKLNDLSVDNKVNNNPDLTGLFGLSKSPNTSSLLERQGSSPKTVGFMKQNTFDNQFDYKNSLTKLYENPSLDMSSESECAPDPPPRPAATLPQIKPPPLPPKKQLNELSMKPPPRPPYSEESHYDYMDKYETGSKSSLNNESSPPPLPVPARKSKFESDFVPEEEDYLTPITFPTVKKDRPIARNAGPILLPPPQKANKKKPSPEPAAIPSIIETETKADNLPNLSLDSLDITLSQLTLSGLNELANKLNIPACQLSNMTLVQLTNYLSNFIKNASNDSSSETGQKQDDSIGSNEHFASFNSDFADFNQFNSTSSTNAAAGGGDSSYDRYAVFRELLQEEIKQTKIDSEPQEIVEEMEKMDEAPIEEPPQPTVNENVVDRYAALREIVESELKISDNNKITEENENEEDEDEEEDEPEPVQLETIDEVIAEQNSINEEKNSSVEQDLNTNNLKIIDDLKNDNEKMTASKENIIDYDNMLDNVVDVNKSPTPMKSPVKVKSPVPTVVTEIIQSNTRLNSGSLSDVISGSSPEVDLTGSASENAKKQSDAAGESWAIFDQPSLVQEACKDAKAVQSEEGVSPWSSDSKEFGNGSPPEWRPRVDSGSGGEHWVGGVRSSGRRDQEGGWWDTSAEPEVQYYPANRRSTDSYEDECYDCYDRPRRRRQTTWSGGQTGGHSSSSRDVSPWEEEPRRREGRQTTWASRHTNRQHSFERHNRDRRHTDSWDEEDDDYEYEDEHSGRFHWPERHPSRDSERDRHPIDRHSTTSGRDMDDWDERRREHRRRREMDRERWCCPDYDTGEQEKPSGRYGSGRWATTDRRKHEDRYYGRDMESPWEDEYGNEPEEPQPHYLTARRTRIRPSSASEMDRKTGEIKARPGQFYYGGSDGERDRRYKAGRRSKSRDSSQYPESAHAHNRHKLDPGLTLRNPHRLKHPKNSQFDGDFPAEITLKKLENPKEISVKKPLGASGRKKSKESPKTEEINTFPRKGTSRAQSLFENDFVPSESESPVSARAGQRFTFENDFETSEAESPTVSKPVKTQRPKKPSLNPSWFEADSRRPKNNTKPMRYKQKSLFEDDFSPTAEKPGEAEDSIPSIKEEHGTEGEDSLGSSNFENSSSRKRLSKMATRDGNLKKSESVNIFARENDPFDDDFFSTNGSSEVNNTRNSELKWTEQFSDFDIQRAK